MEIKPRSPALHADSLPVEPPGKPYCGRPGFDPWVGKIPWRRERLPTSAFWPGELHGLYSPWGGKESDMTKRLSLTVLGVFFLLTLLLLCLTLCDPTDCSASGFPVLHCLLEFSQTHVHCVDDAIQPPHPVLSPFPPAFNLSQH